jgi:predicted DNA-binding transcriptional regulator AlpA
MLREKRPVECFYMDEHTRQMHDFIEKCQRRQGMTFMQAFDCWLDLAPLRGGTVVRDFSLSAETASQSETSSLALSSVAELLTVREVCDLLHISRASLYRYGIPGKCKVGGQVRYVKREVDIWISQARVSL